MRLQLMDTMTTGGPMRERITSTPGFLDLEAGMRAAIADATGWHHADLRPSEEAWLDQMLDAVANSAIDAAVETAERGVAAVLPLTEARLAPGARNEALRAALAALGTDR